MRTGFVRLLARCAVALWSLLLIQCAGSDETMKPSSTSSVTVALTSAYAERCSGYPMGFRVTVQVTNQGSSSVELCQLAVQTLDTTSQTATLDFVAGTTVQPGQTVDVQCETPAGIVPEPSGPTEVPATASLTFVSPPDTAEQQKEASGTVQLGLLSDSCERFTDQPCSIQ